MRLPRFAAFLLIAAIAFSYQVSAAYFTDDMIAPQNTAEVQYFGLKPYAGATYGLSDQTLLAFANNSAPQGHALYRVNGAETVTVGIYTVYGTCVSRQETGVMLSRGTKQAAWSKSKNEIYSDFGGSFWRIELDFESRYDPVFSPTSALPEDAIGFGLNIYATPGKDKPLPVSVTKSVSEALSYEEYTAAIPSGTQYIKVEINDVTSYPLKSGGTMPNRVYTSLASVKISGEALVMGEPAKVEQQPDRIQTPIYVYGGKDDKDDDDDEKEASVAAPAKKLLPAEAEFEEEEIETPASSEKSSSSKFEGTITASSKQEKPKTSKAVAPTVEESSSKIERSESEAPRSEIPREAVYEIRREDSGGGMTSGVTAYIIIVSGVLALLLIFGKRR